jgi:UDP-glucose 6-dehydrogenase
MMVIIEHTKVQSMATAESPIYDELLELLAVSADVERLLSFRLSAQRQARLEDLLQKNRHGLLTPDERGEPRGLPMCGS